MAGGVDVQTSALVVGEWLASRPGHFILGETAAGLDAAEKRIFSTLPVLEL
jgi:hypothetical protein